MPISAVWPIVRRVPPPEPAAARRIPLWVHPVLWGLLLLTDGLELWGQLHDPGHLGPAALHRNMLTSLARGLGYDVLYAAVFYLNWRELIPRLLARGRVGPYALGVLLLLAAFVALRVGISATFFPDVLSPGMRPRTLMQRVVPYTITGLMMVFLSSGLKVTGDYLRGQRRRRELEHQQLLTELTLLKMQVNPHFLFNTLNNIYALTTRKSDRAPEAVLRLAEIMRYMLYESSADAVPLARELTHLRGFLDLQRLRLPATDAAAAIVFDCAGAEQAATFLVPPMLLLPLVENAFKHGDLAARPAVVMQLRVEAETRLHFTVSNRRTPDVGHLLDQPGGVGLTNLRRRLQLLYPGRHTLAISTADEQYEVSLTLENRPVAPTGFGQSG